MVINLGNQNLIIIKLQIIVLHWIHFMFLAYNKDTGCCTSGSKKKNQCKLKLERLALFRISVDLKINASWNKHALLYQHNVHNTKTE